jgi:hypothetical protein
VTLLSFLRDVVEILEEAGVPYMITGSLAAAHYGPPRATQDVDVVVETSADALDRVVELLRSQGLYVNPEAARGAHRTRGQFNAIDPEWGWKLDLIVRKDRPFSVEEFSRRVPATLLGIEVFVPSLEDLIPAKLEWATLGHSELQRQDVLHLIEAGGGGLDQKYIQRWLGELGLLEEWGRLVE